MSPCVVPLWVRLKPDTTYNETPNSQDPNFQNDLPGVDSWELEVGNWELTLETRSEPCSCGSHNLVVLGLHQLPLGLEERKPRVVQLRRSNHAVLVGDFGNPEAFTRQFHRLLLCGDNLARGVELGRR